MLLTLTLNHIALIKQASLEFSAGFNVITGETGAGKSLILDALTLCLGGRADTSLVRFDCDSAEIYAEFTFLDNPSVIDWLSLQSRAIDDDVLLIRRQLHPTGRSKAWLNGSPISLSELKSLATHLVQIHSQHAQQSLLKPAFVVQWLDVIAGLTPLAVKTQQAYRAYQKLLEMQTSIQDQASQRQTQIRLLENQLEDVGILDGLDYRLIEAEHEEQSNIDALIQQANELLSLLENDDYSVEQLLSRSIRLSEQQAELSQTYAACTEHLHIAQTAINETINLLQDYASQQTPEPARLQQLDQQLAIFHRLAKKYQTQPTSLTALTEQWQAQLAELTSLPEPDAIAAEVEQAYQDYITLASQLDEQRKAYAPDVCQQLTDNIKPLAMPKARCEFTFEPLESPNAQGISHIELLFSANPGMPLQPLQKVASGGELSRLALVMQVLKAQDYQQLLVFDEVDIGISGATAQIVGELLRNLGKHQQLLAITHQAQVAAFGHTHILVHKVQDDHDTTSHMQVINQEQRVDELARMSGGVDISHITRQHAQSLLDQVKQSTDHGNI